MSLPPAIHPTPCRSIFTGRAGCNRCPELDAAPLALPPTVDQARTSASAQNDPSAALECSSQPPPSRCCDDHLNPPCVRWYLRYKLSFRDLVEMMAERGLSLAHTTIMRWIQRYVPEFEKRWNRFARLAGRSWRVDETYVKIKGRWTYLYRAVDKEGKTVDFLLRAKRDVAAAKAFFRRAFKRPGQTAA